MSLGLQCEREPCYCQWGPGRGTHIATICGNVPFNIFSEGVVFSTAKIDLHQYVIFIKPRNFVTADIKCVTVYILNISNYYHINERGPTYPLPPPHNTPTFSFNFLCETGKNDKCTKLKGKILINVLLIWFKRTCKTIPFNSILEFSILLDFKMRNVIIWHWFIKNLVGT